MGNNLMSVGGVLGIISAFAAIVAAITAIIATTTAKKSVANGAMSLNIAQEQWEEVKRQQAESKEFFSWVCEFRQQIASSGKGSLSVPEGKKEWALQAQREGLLQQAPGGVEMALTGTKFLGGIEDAIKDGAFGRL